VNPNYFQANRLNWNDRVAAHKESSDPAYDIKGFLAGKSTLKSIEIEELGDVSGKSMLHLMCHFALDTLSWARRGAVVTGVDFSDEAITLAKSNTKRAKLDARFICSNVYDLPNVLHERFDIVVATYGILSWLPDFHHFAKIASNSLKLGGSFLLIDDHPTRRLFKYDESANGFRVSGQYFHRANPKGFIVEETYTGDKLKENFQMFIWRHDLGTIIAALLAHDLRITSLREYPYLMYKRYPIMVSTDNGYWKLPEDQPELPLMFSLTAQKI